LKRAIAKKLLILLVFGAMKRQAKTHLITSMGLIVIRAILNYLNQTFRKYEKNKRKKKTSESWQKAFHKTIHKSSVHL